MSKVIGADKLNRELRDLTKDVSRGVGVALMAGGNVLVDAIRDKIIEQGLFEDGDLYDSVNATAASRTSVRVSEGPLPYVFAHEFGLPNQKITDRQRGFFWAKFRETREDMWRALALSDTYTIPARPHFRPALMQSRRKIVSAVASKINKLTGG